MDVITPSGSIVIGPFSDLLHAVGGGTGVRLTCVFCQHQDLVDGHKKNKKGEITHLLTGARKSIIYEKKKELRKTGEMLFQLWIS